MKYLSKFYIALIFLILYAPIIVVILFSRALPSIGTPSCSATAKR